jgi:hypothetical protein
MEKKGISNRVINKILKDGYDFPPFTTNDVFSQKVKKLRSLVCDMTANF